jgi:hypothetical protein
VDRRAIERGDLFVLRCSWAALLRSIRAQPGEWRQSRCDDEGGQEREAERHGGSTPTWFLVAATP